MRYRGVELPVDPSQDPISEFEKIFEGTGVRKLRTKEEVDEYFALDEDDDDEDDDDEFDEDEE